jgi:hypothetical protein
VAVLVAAAEGGARRDGAADDKPRASPGLLINKSDLGPWLRVATAGTARTTPRAVAAAARAQQDCMARV